MIVADELTKQYKDFKLDVSFDIPSGSITGLIGKNGAGKSTTIKLILGLTQPDSGSVSIMGNDSSKLTADIKQNLGVTLAESSLVQTLNIKNINKILKSMYKKHDENFFISKCSEAGLPFDKQIGDFSTGMKAKLRVMMAISHKAKLLVLDEPTSGLDVQARMDILDLLREYMAEDEERTILITSHISSDLEGLCDDVYLIDNGKILLREDTDCILSSYAIIKVSDSQYSKLDTEHILHSQKKDFGYICLTNQRQFYSENYPDIVIEKATIDDLILMLTGGNN